MAKPILKWAGGKRQLLPVLIEKMPQKFKSGKIKKYAEPFIGGGALLLYLLENFDLEKVYASDINPELILLYKVVQSVPEKLNEEVEKLSLSYFESEEQDKRELVFYKFREQFNEKVGQLSCNEPNNPENIKRAALMIFLNRTCFNGLFRVNKKGLFNVPFGKYKNPKISDSQNILEVSLLLQKVEFSLADYSQIPDAFLEDTFIYFDPPYRPLSNSSSFTAYSKSEFNDSQQRELSEYFKRVSSSNGLFLMLSNSDPKNSCENDNFFDDLYKGFCIDRVLANRMINAKSSGRGKINELLITNFKDD